MIIDIHSQYIPLQSQKVAAEIGKRHSLMLAQDDRGRDVVMRAGKPYLGPVRPNSTTSSSVTRSWSNRGRSADTIGGQFVFFYWMAAEETAEFTRWLSDNACKLLGIAN